MSDEGNYWDEVYWDDYAMGNIGGSLSGAYAGFKLTGNPYGAIAGAFVGAGLGTYDAHQNVQAQKAARERDEEIESQIADIDKKIGDVDTMGQFIAASGAGAAEQAQRAKVQASQDAARMNLSEGAKAEYMRQKERDVQGAYGQMLAQAVPAAKAADIAEKRRLGDEKQFVLTGSAQRQALMDQGQGESDLLGTAGEIAGYAMMAQGFADTGTATTTGSTKSIDSTNIDPMDKYGDLGTNKGVAPPTMDMSDSKSASKYGTDVADPISGTPAIGETDMSQYSGGGAQTIEATPGGDPYDYRRTMDAAGNYSYETRKGDADWVALPEGDQLVGGRFGEQFATERQIDRAVDEVAKPTPQKPERQVLSSAQEKPDHEVFDFDFGIDKSLLGGTLKYDESAPVRKVEDIGLSNKEYEMSVLDALGVLFGRERRRGGNK